LEGGGLTIYGNRIRSSSENNRKNKLGQKKPIKEGDMQRRREMHFWTFTLLKESLRSERKEPVLPIPTNSQGIKRGKGHK